MFQFTRLLHACLCIQQTAVGNPGIITCLSIPPGFSQTSTPFSHLMPRHPPCALNRLAVEIPNSATTCSKIIPTRRLGNPNQTATKQNLVSNLLINDITCGSSAPLSCKQARNQSQQTNVCTESYRIQFANLHLSGPNTCSDGPIENRAGNAS